MLSGKPLTGGTSTFTIRATAANGCFAELSYTVSAPLDVPTLPQVFFGLLALGLLGIGVLQLRRQVRRA